MARYPLIGEPLPAGLTTLEGYARRTGRPVAQVEHRAAGSHWPDFPERYGHLRRKGSGRGKGVYWEKELDEFFKAHPLVPVLAQPLPAGMTTLEGYARRTGQPVDQVKARAARSRWPDFPGRCGRLKRKAAGNSENVYRAGELDKFFKAHPLVPILAQPLPAGLTTLDRYAERARRPCTGICGRDSPPRSAGWHAPAEAGWSTRRPPSRSTWPASRD